MYPRYRVGKKREDGYPVIDAFTGKTIAIHQLRIGAQVHAIAEDQGYEAHMARLMAAEFAALYDR